ncbi:MAG: hypothetical protein M1549_00260 [Candidatus Dependentiae bacterium]|nr:hypothetical protein [Candidatus Dependentiae bacterium]
MKKYVVLTLLCTLLSGRSEAMQLFSWLLGEEKPAPEQKVIDDIDKNLANKIDELLKILNHSRDVKKSQDSAAAFTGQVRAISLRRKNEIDKKPLEERSAFIENCRKALLAKKIKVPKSWEDELKNEGLDSVGLILLTSTPSNITTPTPSALKLANTAAAYAKFNDVASYLKTRSPFLTADLENVDLAERKKILSYVFDYLSALNKLYMTEGRTHGFRARLAELAEPSKEASELENRLSTISKQILDAQTVPTDQDIETYINQAFEPSETQSPFSAQERVNWRDPKKEAALKLKLKKKEAEQEKQQLALVQTQNKTGTLLKNFESEFRNTPKDRWPQLKIRISDALTKEVFSPLALYIGSLGPDERDAFLKKLRPLPIQAREQHELSVVPVSGEAHVPALRLTEELVIKQIEKNPQGWIENFKKEALPTVVQALQKEAAQEKQLQLAKNFVDGSIVAFAGAIQKRDDKGAGEALLSLLNYLNQTVLKPWAEFFKKLTEEEKRRAIKALRQQIIKKPLNIREGMRNWLITMALEPEKIESKILQWKKKIPQMVEDFTRLALKQRETGSIEGQKEEIGTDSAAWITEFEEKNFPRIMEKMQQPAEQKRQLQLMQKFENNTVVSFANAIQRGDHAGAEAVLQKLLRYLHERILKPWAEFFKKLTEEEKRRAIKALRQQIIKKPLNIREGMRNWLITMALEPEKIESKILQWKKKIPQMVEDFSGMGLKSPETRGIELPERQNVGKSEIQRGGREIAEHGQGRPIRSAKPLSDLEKLAIGLRELAMQQTA